MQKSHIHMTGLVHRKKNQSNMTSWQVHRKNRQSHMTYWLVGREYKHPVYKCIQAKWLTYCCPIVRLPVWIVTREENTQAGFWTSTKLAQSGCQWMHFLLFVSGSLSLHVNITSAPAFCHRSHKENINTAHQHRSTHKDSHVLKPKPHFIHFISRCPHFRI